MKTRARHLRLACTGFLALVLGLAWTSPVQAEVTYTGRAFGAYVNVPSPGVGPVFLSDTGELSPDGTPRSASFLDVELPGVLSAELLVAHTSGANGVAESSAFLAGVTVLDGVLTAKAVGAQSVATCNGVQGFTEVLDLTLAGQTVTVDPFAPNQRFGPISVNGLTTATLIVNEQIQNSGGGFREITVNAVHLTLEAAGAIQAEVILSSARSDIHGCPGCTAAPACHDFVTGGGWIKVGNSRANFGFNAGFKAGSSVPEVHLNYIDHITGMHVKAASITLYEKRDTDTTRHLEGSAEIDGVTGFRYIVDVADNNEPGRGADTFKISLSNGYSAGGALAGGNIQLHKPCP